MNREELELRTLTFSKKLLKTLAQLPSDLINKNLISQTTRSGTSIGANYREANASASEKDFKNKMNISFKEAKEVKYWLEILSDRYPNDTELISLKKEADELSRIFGKAVSTCRLNAKLKNPRLKSEI